MRRIGPAAALAAVMLCAPALGQSSWQPYANERYGFTMDVPSDWRAAPAPDNGDGQTWTSPDGKGEIRAWSAYRDTAESLDEALDAAARGDDDDLISYRRRKADEVVTSGLNGGFIFYKRAKLSCGDALWTTLLIRYPQDRKKAYDALVEHVARSLQPAGNC